MEYVNASVCERSFISCNNIHGLLASLVAGSVKPVLYIRVLDNSGCRGDPHMGKYFCKGMIYIQGREAS